MFFLRPLHKSVTRSFSSGFNHLHRRLPSTISLSLCHLILTLIPTRSHFPSLSAADKVRNAKMTALAADKGVVLTAELTLSSIWRRHFRSVTKTKQSPPILDLKIPSLWLRFSDNYWNFEARFRRPRSSSCG